MESAERKKNQDFVLQETLRQAGGNIEQALDKLKLEPKDRDHIRKQLMPISSKDNVGSNSKTKIKSEPGAIDSQTTTSASSSDREPSSRFLSPNSFDHSYPLKSGNLYKPEELEKFPQPGTLVTFISPRGFCSEGYSNRRLRRVTVDQDRDIVFELESKSLEGGVNTHFSGHDFYNHTICWNDPK